ncbi:hypothetical protein [Blastococcus sp. LR1]|uniref:hypothetical protein n=1 Tax=Blastococcus sp. LR1 TaxID=2877000 RepID=UPI001CCC926C|nr:hypothetical protein [Blastococcus sp. LR1]MCA0145742.1 hypothetical protein [Blastococcus sp. LR1]
MPHRPPWSDRRRRTLLVPALGVVLGGLGGVGLPAEYGVSAGILAALCAFLLVAAVVVFLAIPGPGTAGVLARSSPVAGSSFVVAVLLLLSTDDLRWVWSLVAVAAVGWTAYAVRETRRDDVGG